MNLAIGITFIGGFLAFIFCSYMIERKGNNAHMIEGWIFWSGLSLLVWAVGVLLVAIKLGMIIWRLW